MDKKEKAPTSLGAKSYKDGKESKHKYNNLCGNDLRVLELLSKGSYNVIDIGKILDIPDPRSNIRYLRKAGFVIGDYWKKTTYSRCKIYFIKDREGGLNEKH